MNGRPIVIAQNQDLGDCETTTKQDEGHDDDEFIQLSHPELRESY